MQHISSHRSYEHGSVFHFPYPGLLIFRFSIKLTLDTLYDQLNAALYTYGNFNDNSRFFKREFVICKLHNLLELI